MSARVWVVIPTYNEAENIEAILRATTAELERAAPDQHTVLVVDDNSPDGTGQLADAVARELGTVEVLHREQKTGLGHAYLAGFARALAGGAQMVIEMDADFSHQPMYLGPLLEAARDADLVLGSRYVQGGGVRDWGLLRRIVSRGGGLYARLVLRVNIRDLTGCRLDFADGTPSLLVYPSDREAYGRLTQGCNACHATTDHSFVVIKAPDASPFPNQDFQPKQ